MPGEQHLAHVS